MAVRTSFLCWALTALLLSAPAAAAATVGDASGAEAPGAVAVLERVSGRPVIYSVADGGLRRVNLIREGAQYRLPIEVETGPNDAASFRLPDGEVAVAPGTLMRIAAPVRRAKDDTLLQRIFQRAGSALFSVDRREVEHFEVETPFLVSVVKGTTFTVVVHDDGATVSLHQGHLQVNGRDGLGSVELWPGDVAYSGQDGAVQKLVGTLTRRAMADEALPGRANQPASARPANAVTDRMMPSSRSADERALPAVDNPANTDVARDIELTDALERAVVTLADAGDLALVELADGSDLVRDAVLPDDVLTSELGLGDLDPAVPDDLARGDLLADVGLNPSDLADDLGSAGDLVADLGAGAGGLVADLGDDVGELLGGIGASAGNLVSDLGAGTGDLLGNLGGTTGDLLGGLGDTTGDLLGDVGDTAGDLLGGLGDTAGDLLGGVGDTAGDLLGGAAGGLLGGAGDTAGDLLGGIGDTAGDLLGGVGDTAGGLVGGLTDGAGDLLDQTGSTIGDLGGSVGDTAGDLLGGVGDTAGDLLGGVGEGLSGVTGGTLGALGGLLGGLRL